MPVTRQQIFADILPVFQRVFGDKSIQLTDETTANDIERWDSLNHLTMIVSVEQKFGIKFKTAEVTRFANVGAMVSSIESKLSRPN